jgi:hypothetical protein
MTVYLIDICLSNCYGIIFKKIHSMFFTTSQPGLVVVIIEPFKCEDPKVDWELLDKEEADRIKYL